MKILSQKKSWFLTLGDKCKKSYIGVNMKKGKCKNAGIWQEMLFRHHVFQRLFFSSQGKTVLQLSKLSFKNIALMALITIITYISCIRKLWNLTCMRSWAFQKHLTLFHSFYIAQLVIFKQNLLYSRVFEELFLRKGKKGKYQGDKFSFHCVETLTLTEIESHGN